MTSNTGSDSSILTSALSGRNDPNDPPISPPHTPRPAPAAVLPPELILRILNDASKIEQMDAMTSPVMRSREKIHMDVDQKSSGGVQQEGQQPGGGEKMNVDQPAEKAEGSHA